MRARVLLASVAAGWLAGCAGLPAPPAAPAASEPAPALAPVPTPTPATSPAPAPAASSPPASTAGKPFTCQDGSSFRLQPQGDFILIEGLPGGPHRLARDAGGFTPQHTVWSSGPLRVELGLGPEGRDALLLYNFPPMTVRCTAA